MQTVSRPSRLRCTPAARPVAAGGVHHTALPSSARAVLNLVEDRGRLLHRPTLMGTTQLAGTDGHEVGLVERRACQLQLRLSTVRASAVERPLHGARPIKQHCQNSSVHHPAVLPPTQLGPRFGSALTTSDHNSGLSDVRATSLAWLPCYTNRSATTPGGRNRSCRSRSAMSHPSGATRGAHERDASGAGWVRSQSSTSAMFAVIKPTQVSAAP
jgi:hypothetical protein